MKSEPTSEQETKIPSTSETYTQKKLRLIRKWEIKEVSRLLTEHNGNVTQAALEAGINRSNFHRLVRKLGLNINSFKRYKPWTISIDDPTS